MSDETPNAVAPCPFCGATGDQVIAWPVDSPHKGFRAGCVNPECDINPFTRTIWPTEGQAWQSWNRRKNEPVKLWCAWCGKWGDHQSGWCEKARAEEARYENEKKG